MGNHFLWLWFVRYRRGRELLTFGAIWQTFKIQYEARLDKVNMELTKQKLEKKSHWQLAAFMSFQSILERKNCFENTNLKLLKIFYSEMYS